MMYDDINQVLTRAYDLIEAEKLDEARALLEPVLDREKDNADAWWLYAHAVADTETARKALQNVLRADPNYPDARDLMRQLEDAFPAAPSPLRPIERIDARRPPAALPDLPPTLPDLPEKVEEAWEFEDSGEREQAPGRFPTPRQLAILIPIVVAVIAGGLLVILNSVSPSQITAPTPTIEGQAAVATLPVSDFTPIPLDTVVPSNVNTEQPTSAITTTGDAYEPLYNALGGFTIPRNGIEMTETGLGSTLLVSICTIAGPDLRAALPEAMNAIASASGSLTTDADALGAKMLNCGNNTTLLVIAVPLEDAVAYANGELDNATFQALWRSQ